MKFHFFDPAAEYGVIERRLPHWEQAGATYFITIRTADSMPCDVVERWIDERDLWLRNNGIDPRSPDWKWRIELLPPARRQEYHGRLLEKWETDLDRCHGECVLRRTELSALVAESLLHFDGDRYTLGDFVVMPNHLHVLVGFPAYGQMLQQCRSWKRFTATQINKRLGRRGQFWQEDGFDHLVRNSDAFDYYRRYIAENPHRARLREGEYHYHRANL